jgi:hypothetical protein
LDTGAVVAVTVRGADEGDPATSVETLIQAAERIEVVVPEGEGLHEVVADVGMTAEPYSRIGRFVRRPCLSKTLTTDC